MRLIQSEFKDSHFLFGI